MEDDAGTAHAAKEPEDPVKAAKIKDIEEELGSMEDAWQGVEDSDTNEKRKKIEVGGWHRVKPIHGHPLPAPIRYNSPPSAH